jgi:hypothetical protein
VAPASVISDYRVAQAPDSLDFHFHHVARFQWTNPGSASGNDVAGQQRLDVGYPTHQKIRRVDQIVGAKPVRSRGLPSERLVKEAEILN